MLILPSIVSAKSAEGSTALARKVAGEGMVLLENNGALPVKKGDMVSVFGIGQVQYYKVGTGSGSVNSDYSINLLTGLRNNKNIKVNEELAAIYENYNQSGTDAAKSKQGDPGGMGGGPGMPSVTVSEMPLDNAIVSNAAKKSKTAIVTFSRLSGEGSDRTVTKGDYYLTDLEEDMLSKVRKAFDKVVVVLNITGVMDMNWVDKFKPDSVLVAWLAGMEGGNAMADIISGDVNPSGKLVDTFAKDYWDYPSSYNFGGFVDGYETVTADGTEVQYWGMIPNHKVPAKGTAYRRPINNRYFVEYKEGIYVGYRYFETFNKEVKYPFGYGLSYTTFSISDVSVKADDKLITVSATVKNTGKVAGKEVVQIYFSSPDDKLEKPAKELAAYAKTDLLQPDQSQSLTISYKTNDMSSYDERKAAYILESGSYRVYAGNSIKNVQEAGLYKLSSEKITEQLTNQLSVAPNVKLTLLSKKDPKGTFPTTPPMRAEEAATSAPGPVGQAETITNTESTEEEKIKFKDVYDGKASMKDFISQLTDMELTGLVVGPGMGSANSMFGEFSSKVDGTAGQTVTLNRLGIPTTILSDGPAGIRITESCTAFPVGTLVGCTWNAELTEEMGRAIGREAAANNIDMWLAPGMNIHRNPLCGRNFEYYSEDPLISGTMAAAVARGVQSNGVGVTFKHFAANNQETNRFDGIDTSVTERTLREIYLKGFEIAVRTSAPWSIMTSYNSLNGAYTAARKDLSINVLRNEWGFNGYIVTDWEGDGIYSIEAIKARNDLLMPGFPGQIKYIYSKLKDGTLKRSELEQCAADLLTISMKTKSFAKYYGIKDGSNGAYKAPESWFNVLKTKTDEK
jgi:beta-glucosidase-like glycosyl hydrolase